MQNKHQDHPEDLLLTGETWAIDAMFDSESLVSLKIDGCPAVVWGIHPETDQFFVGTKSVFNKRLIKVNYTHDDIKANHKQPDLQLVLSACLDYLPRTEGVYQGDFIGFGGSDVYTPNTLTYTFPEVVTEAIIIAPHTRYHVPGKMSNAEAEPLLEDLEGSSACRFVQPMVDRIPLENPWHVDASKCNFLTQKQAADAKVAINAIIRQGDTPTVEQLTEIIGDEQLATIYRMVMILKGQVLRNTITYFAPKTTLGSRKVLGEGLVFNTVEGSFKVVDRAQFAYANFNQGKFA